MFRLWYETVHGWSVFGDYDTREEARIEMSYRVGRAYIVMLSGAMGRCIEKNW
jgi:hypothetical protein